MLNNFNQAIEYFIVAMYQCKHWFNYYNSPEQFILSCKKKGSVIVTFDDRSLIHQLKNKRFIYCFCYLC